VRAFRAGKHKQSEKHWATASRLEKEARALSVKWAGGKPGARAARGRRAIRWYGPVTIFSFMDSRLTEDQARYIWEMQETGSVVYAPERHDELLRKGWLQPQDGDNDSGVVELSGHVQQMRDRRAPMMEDWWTFLEMSTEPARAYRGRGAKKPTYAKARRDILAYLGSEGWDLSSPSLKVPHATSPGGSMRLYFKTQSVHLDDGGKPFSLGASRSMWLDIRELTPQQFLEHVKRWTGRGAW